MILSIIPKDNLPIFMFFIPQSQIFIKKIERCFHQLSPSFFYSPKNDHFDKRKGENKKTKKINKRKENIYTQTHFDKS